MSNLPTIRKAIAGLLAAIATWGVTAAPDGIQGVEWWGLLGVIATFLSVFGTTNEPGPDDGGQTNVVGAVLLIVLILILCRIFGLL